MGCPTSPKLLSRIVPRRFSNVWKNRNNFFQSLEKVEAACRCLTPVFTLYKV